LLHVGKRLHTRREYFICNKLIPPSDVIHDLGIIYNSKLGFQDFIDEIVSKAFQRINLLFRSFISGNISILTRAFITYVRPLVEYCSYIWSPHQLYLIQKIERVYKYSTKRALHGTRLHYKERLQVLNLEFLEIRRIKSDIKLCFKTVGGLYVTLALVNFLSYSLTIYYQRPHYKELITNITCYLIANSALVKLLFLILCVYVLYILCFVIRVRLSHGKIKLYLLTYL
jgi:hypothetical protein